MKASAWSGQKNEHTCPGIQMSISNKGIAVGLWLISMGPTMFWWAWPLLHLDCVAQWAWLMDLPKWHISWIGLWKIVMNMSELVAVDDHKDWRFLCKPPHGHARTPETQIKKHICKHHSVPTIVIYFAYCSYFNILQWLTIAIVFELI